MRIFSVARIVALWVGLSLFWGGAASAGDQVLRGAAPAWVVAVEGSATLAAPGPDDGLRVLLLDTQYRAESDQQSYYVHTRSAALSPQGLAALGAVGLTWSPETQDVTVHQVNIVRGDEVIDVLATQTFETLRREENLEQAILDGRLTAVIQPSGLRAGDILDVAYTITSRDPVVGSHADHAINLNFPMTVSQVHFKASWPTFMPVKVRARNDWISLPIRQAGGYSSVEINQQNAHPVLIPVDAPGRFQQPHLIEFTDYRDWAEVAGAIRTLYDNARRLEPQSPLHVEIERLRAVSDDPAVQAAAALRLVQDQVRYVGLLMGEGALTPATADETWTRRFGDCKGKTTLLLALLDGLGIPAAPAAVSLLEGDGLAERLPGLSAFDHVLVRTVIADRVYWLDGTRTGDRKLDDISTPPFHWALPLTDAARLEALDPAPRSRPDSETTIALDASAGLYAPAGVAGEVRLRGDAAAVVSGQLGMASEAQKDQFLRSYWTALLGDPTITEVNSAYDADANELVLAMTGSKMLDWPDEGLTPPGSTYRTLSTDERPEGPFQDAPHAISHPTFLRQTTTLRLPSGGQGFRVSGGRFDRTELGHHHSRTVEMDGDLVTIQISTRSLTDEISAEEAARDRTAADARTRDLPRVFAPDRYRPTDGDRAAWTANEPKTADEWLDRAYALAQGEDYTAAVDAATKAVELDPESSAAWANRGLWRFWAGDREGAASDLDKAVDIDPSERFAMNGNALLAMEDKRYDDAVVEMSRALRQAPTDDFVLTTRARAYIGLGQWDRALRDIDALIALQPDDATLKLRRVQVLEQAGRHDEADAEIASLVRSDPDERLFSINQAALLLERKRHQEASDALEPVLVDNPSDMSALTLRARASVALGRSDLASRDFAAMREARPDDAQTLNSICWTAALGGMLLEEALQACDAALVLKPDAGDILDSRGRVLLQMGRADDAVAAYDLALAQSPDRAASLYGRGLAPIALGRVAEGEADKAAAVLIDPDVIGFFTSYSHGEETATP